MNTIFQTLEQRVIFSYVETFPPFVPNHNGEVSAQAQQRFYEFMSGMYRSLFDNPTALFSGLHDDDCFTYRFNRAADKKPVLDKNMRSIKRKIDDLLAFLFSLERVRHDDDANLTARNRRMNRAHVKILENCGVVYSKQNGEHIFTFGDTDVAATWVWLAELGSQLRFSRCMFRENHSYATDIYTNLLGDDLVGTLLDYCNRNGFSVIDNHDGEVSLDLVKDYGKKPTPVKEAWAEREHSGVSFRHHGYVARPACVCLRIPHMKRLLERFDQMSTNLQRFVVANCKHCDNCRYCVQTDKSGTRKLMMIEVADGGVICPLFPGFTFCWDTADATLAANIAEFLDFVDKTLKP